MEVRNGFAGLFAMVDDNAEAVATAGLAGNFAGGEQQVAEQRFVFGGSFPDARDRFLRNDQEVNGSLRIDVFNGGATIVFVDDLSGNLPLDNPGKEGLFAHVGTESSERLNVRQTVKPSLWTGPDSPRRKEPISPTIILARTVSVFS